MKKINFGENIGSYLSPYLSFFKPIPWGRCQVEKKVKFLMKQNSTLCNQRGYHERPLLYESLKSGHSKSGETHPLQMSKCYQIQAYCDEHGHTIRHACFHTFRKWSLKAFIKGAVSLIQKKKKRVSRMHCHWFCK